MSVLLGRAPRDDNGDAARHPRAVILAGGKGTRLGPFTTILPKPLLPLGDRAILEIVVQQLRTHGFTELTLAVGYLAHLIEAVFGDGSSYGVAIDYHHERVRLGTAGPLASIRDLDGGPFLMMNGDVITTLDFGELVDAHVRSGNALTIATQQRTATIDFGVLVTDASSSDTEAVTGYIEKPSSEYLVSMGIYVIEPRLLALIEPNVYLDFPDLVLRALGAGERVGAFRYDGVWLDIGRHEDYERAIREYADPSELLSPQQA